MKKIISLFIFILLLTGCGINSDQKKSNKNYVTKPISKSDNISSSSIATKQDKQSVQRRATTSDLLLTKNEKDETDSWQTYVDEKNGLELKYPSEMKITKAIMIKVTSENEILNDINNLRKNNQCTGRSCPGDKTLNNNFDILSRAGTCPYTENFKNDVKKLYTLFSRGINNIELVESIFNENTKICTLKTINVDGYDVSLTNIDYRTVFMDNGRIIRVDFPIFPKGVFAETDDFYIKLGYKDNSCDTACSKNELKIFENYSNNPTAKNNINIYDKIISTIKFIKRDE